MRHKFHILEFITVLLSCFLFFIAPVHADNTYKIKQYHINVNVLKNGDAELTQQITYDFDGNFHGVYYNQDLRGIKGVSNISVSSEQNKKKTNLMQANTGTNNTYTLNQTKDNLQIKVFHAISDEVATFTYHYLLHGVVTNYNDTAELNWKIIGEKWDVPLEDVLITIQLPQKNIQSLQGWTHGNLNGHTSVRKKNGQVVIRLNENPANQFVESRLLFPTNVTSANTNKVNKDVKEKIQQREAELARQANEKRKRSQQRSMFIKYAMMILSLLITGAWWLWRWRNKGNPRKALPPLVHSYEIPEYSAEITQTIIDDNEPNSKTFSAYLLELAAVKKISIRKTENEKNDYEVVLLEKKLIEEDKLLKTLFTEVGDGNKFSLKQLNKFGKSSKHSLKIQRAFKSWQKKIFKQARSLNYHDKINAKLRIIALWATIVSSAFLVVSAVMSWNTWWFGLFSLLIILNIIICYSYRKQRPKYSETGWQMFYRFSCFKKMLQDIGRFDMKKVGDLILWEQILPYAVAFGLAKKVIKELKANFSVEELETEFGNYYPIFILGSANFETAFNNSFSSAIAGNASSAGGSSGGFSGGSSGGFGGGSGGGAF